MTAKRRIVLYYPQGWRDRREPPFSRWTDELPLSLLSIAAWPIADGFEVVLIDGSRFLPEEAHRRTAEACDGALLYATTGILGWQVADSLACTRAVKARHPDLPAFIGGWFASVAPELELATGLYDAVGIGQGEITFREIVACVAAGEPLDGVDGLALWRDGRVVRTPARKAVGWDHLLDPPWHLLDPEDYRGPQRREKSRLGARVGYDGGRPRFEISYFGSYGCPLQCTFCCSPELSGLRWKSMPAARMLDDLAGLQERWGFDGVRFCDANFGVSEHRVRDLCEGMLARGVRFDWFAFLQTDSILRFAPATLDRMSEAGLYTCVVGGESGSESTMRRLKKETLDGENLRAAIELDRRGVSAQVTYIIGLPGEDPTSMRATIEQAREIAIHCPRARPEVWPFRPIPGTEDYAAAVARGWKHPETLEDWGMSGEYWNEEAWPDRIPEDVSRARTLFMHFAALAQGRVRERIGFWERRARRRLESGDFANGLLEARAFHVYDRVTRRRGRRKALADANVHA